MEAELSAYYPPLINQTHISKKQNNKYLWCTLLGIAIVLLIYSIIITVVKK
jgi:hypothetical protein